MSDSHHVLASEKIFQSKVFDLVAETVRLPNGRVVERDTVVHPGAVVILPQHADGRLVILRQYRRPLAETILEFPAGTLEAEEEPLTCAKREIIEETGYAASEWIELGKFYPAPGFCSEVQYGFLARGLSDAQAELDEDEIIDVTTLSPEEFQERFSAGEINDAKSAALFLRARSKGLL